MPRIDETLSLTAMSEPKATRTVTVTNPAGIHARAATLIAELVGQFRSDIVLVKNHERVSGSDVLQIMSLGAAPEEQLRLEANGEDAERALDALQALFAENSRDDDENTRN